MSLPGYILIACSRNIETFGIARVLASLGGQGLQLSQQIIIADTSTLTNRALLTSTISIPWLATTWIGPAIGQVFKDAGEVGYRAAYAIFACLLPLACVPLVGVLWWNFRAAMKKDPTNQDTTGEGGQWGSPPTPTVAKDTEHIILEQKSFAQLVKVAWRQLDVTGTIFFTAGCTFILLPLSLAATRPQSWGDRTCFIIFVFGLWWLGC
jgi:hypothetical protein